MSFFGTGQKISLARSLLTKTSPAYVQYYVTARCNMRCEQCNIIYASADCKEMNIDQINLTAENFAKIGVSMVLLIGGEPFARKDLPDIVRAFTLNNIHVRMQTNGLASEEMLYRCIEAGGHDISVSLDSLSEPVQNEINGGISKSWRQTLKTVAMINNLFPENGTGFFGTVLMRKNLEHIKDVLEFATKIGWGMSLVPVHTTSTTNPLGFRTFDDEDNCSLPPSMFPRLKEVIEELKQLRNIGLSLYDSDEYLDDTYRFIVGEKIRWRRRNGGICDSPSLYFALDPDGRVNPCCDHKLDEAFPAYDPDFYKWFRSGLIHQKVMRYTATCEGCMYGSYPEISVSARFIRPMWRRLLFFNVKSKNLLKKMSEDEMIDLATEIFLRNEQHRLSPQRQDPDISLVKH